LLVSAIAAERPEGEICGKNGRNLALSLPCYAGLASLQNAADQHVPYAVVLQFPHILPHVFEFM